jgi:hypothetical protein
MCCIAPLFQIYLLYKKHNPNLDESDGQFIIYNSYPHVKKYKKINNKIYPVK